MTLSESWGLSWARTASGNPARRLAFVRDVSLKLCASGRIIRRGQKSTDVGSLVALSEGDAN